MTASPNGTRGHFYQWILFPFEDHWLLTTPLGSESDANELRCVRGSRLQAPPPVLDLVVTKPMDLGCTALGLPVASARAAALLARVAPADVQLIPCRIDGEDLGFQAVNITSILDGLDPVRTKDRPAAGPFGLSLMIPRYVIDPDRAAGHQLFRLQDSSPVMIVAEGLKQAIMDEGLVGPGLVLLDGEERHYFYPGLPENYRELKPD